MRNLFKFTLSQMSVVVDAIDRSAEIDQVCKSHAVPVSLIQLDA